MGKRIYIPNYTGGRRPEVSSVVYGVENLGDGFGAMGEKVP